MLQDSFHQLIPALEVMNQPVFMLDEDLIVYRNPLARELLPKGMLRLPMSDEELKRTGKKQKMFLVDDKTYHATFTACCGGMLCVVQPELKPLALPPTYLNLIAAMIREPLSDMLVAARALLPEAIDESDPDGPTGYQGSTIYRGLYQLRRLAAQLSDGGRILLEESSPKLDSMDIRRFMNETMASAEDILVCCRLKFNYQPLPRFCMTAFDPAMVERAVWNLIANAAEHSLPGQTVTLRLERDHKFVCIHVENQNNGQNSGLDTAAFANYQKEPNPLDPNLKTGLGLAIVRKIATLHGGTVLFSVNDDIVCVTMSLRIVEPDKKMFILKEPVPLPREMTVSQRGLVELSQLLPREAFHPYDIVE